MRTVQLDCPYKVDYSGFIRDMRNKAVEFNNVPACSQEGLCRPS